MNHKFNLGKVVLLSVLALGIENISACSHTIKPWDSNPLVSFNEQPIREYFNLLRYPNSSKDRQAAENLKSAFKLPKNTEVLIVDADSYIDGLELDSYVKEKCITLRKDGDKLLNEFTNNKYIKFASKKLKNEIIEAMKEYIFKSQTYRDIITCYLARAQLNVNRHRPGITYSIKDIDPQFRYGEYSYAVSTGSITLGKGASREKHFVNTFFGVDSTKGIKFPHGIFGTKLQDILSHEIGHTIFPIYSLSKLIMDRPVQSVEKYKNVVANSLASDLIETQLDKQAYKEWIKSINNQETRRFTMLRTEIEFYMLIPKRNPEKKLGMLFNLTYAELFQIIGIDLVPYAGKNYLIINKMSNMALSAELGLPIRITHTAGKTDRIRSFFTQNAPFDPPSYEITRDLMKPYFESHRDKGALEKIKQIDSLQLCERPLKRVDVINRYRIDSFLPLQENDVWETSTKTFIKFKPNLNVFGAMLELFGTSLDEYTSKIMFPYGVYFPLGSEHRFVLCILKTYGRAVQYFIKQMYKQNMWYSTLASARGIVIRLINNYKA